MRSLWLVVVLGMTGQGCSRNVPPAASPPREGPLLRLAIYYGWPGRINGAASVGEAARAFSAYDVVVLGGGLQGPDHPQHATTREMVKELVLGGAEVYGYIPLGSGVGLSLRQIKKEVKAWRAMGVTGVFFDEAGYDFGNDRKRQNEAFTIAHRQGLRVFANAHDPDHLFAQSKLAKSNPGGLPCVLARGDSYLYESFAVRLGRPEESAQREQKVAKLRRARRLGVRIFGVTTTTSPADFSPQAWQAAVTRARAAGLEGIGWGEPCFSAQDSRLPLRPLPP